MNRAYGAVACGHQATAWAAEEILRQGGNAFDAALAAMFAACVAEPVLASLGGGGFLLAHPGDGPHRLYDFFAHTPRQKRPAGEIDFYPITADFGDAQQEFHIGMGAIAVPGVIRGAWRIHQELGSLPMRELVAPAVSLAREGMEVNAFQHYIATIVRPILCASEAALRLHCGTHGANDVAPEGSLLRNPELADTLETLAREGDAPFYEGEWGRRLITDCRGHGGLLQMADLSEYRVEVRAPLVFRYRDATLATNPPPSLGGSLIAFTLALLQPVALAEEGFSSAFHLRLLARAMRNTQKLRRGDALERLLAQGRPGGMGPLLERYRIADPPERSTRGTTHISVIDAHGALAALTLSNGEGSGYVLPGTGIMLNNMLGEEDLNPQGFHRWRENRRLASMMAPTFLTLADGRRVVTGSGGSNRIRSAILQVVLHLVDFGMDLERAVTAPRIHYENGVLEIEPPRDAAALEAIADEFPDQHLWRDINLYFGGAHSLSLDRDGTLHGAGDPRRGGVCRILA